MNETSEPPCAARAACAVTRRLSRLALASSLLLPLAAAADPMIPVTVRITELIQVDSVDSVPPNLGDFFARVSIRGEDFDSHADICNNEGLEGFILPQVFFDREGFVHHSCGDVPWTFTTHVPLSALMGTQQGQLRTIPIEIRIIDEDPVFDDEVAVISLNVAFGGRWTGTVNWPQNCVNRDPLAGDVAVCWDIEVGLDSDGDGLLDDWEINGLDVDGDGVVDLDLPALGADPMHKDLFVELDWRADSPPTRFAVQRWKEAFAAAPIDAGGVPNPDGLPGINLHVDTGSLTEGGVLVGDNLGGGNELGPEFPVCTLQQLYPAKAANFDEHARGLVFRYGITSTRCCVDGPSFGAACFINSQCPQSGCQSSGGRAEIGGNDFVVWNRNFIGGALMHELGHTLNLRHGGSVDHNCKPNYISVMNYHWSDQIQRLDGTSILDFSPPRRADGSRGPAPLPPLMERSLAESLVLEPGNGEHLIKYTDGHGDMRMTPVGMRVDWNGDGDTEDDGISVNIDDAHGPTGNPRACRNDDIDPAGAPLRGHDDWLHVSLPFLQFGDSADGPINPTEEPEPNDDELREQRETANTADLSVDKSGPAGPFEAGDEVDLDYTLAIANLGPNPALVVRVTDTLPPGAVLLDADPACEISAPGEIECLLPALLQDEGAVLELSVRAPATCAGGLPTPIANEAAVENATELAGEDPDPTNNTTTFETTVVDTTPPTLSLAASPATLWAPNHTLVPITVLVEVEDACDENPTIRLVSIASDEAGNASGSGNTAPDVVDAAFGTDDRHFLLRAERSGRGAGRTYTITYEAEDASGNVTEATVTVTVAHDERGR